MEENKVNPGSPEVVIADLQQQIATATDAIKQLTESVNALSVERMVLNQTLGEIITANVQSRTAMIILENKSKEIAAQLAKKETEVVDLGNKLKVANTVVEKTTNLVPPEPSKPKK